MDTYYEYEPLFLKKIPSILKSLYAIILLDAYIGTKPSKCFISHKEKPLRRAIYKNTK